MKMTMSQFIKSVLDALGYEIKKKGAVQARSISTNTNQQCVAANSLLDKGNTDKCGLKVIDKDREFLYELLGAMYLSLHIKPTVIELGVLRGQNANVIRNIMNPQRMFLIDSWSAKEMYAYRKINDKRDWVNDLDYYQEYFGGSLGDQSTFDRLYTETIDKFNPFSDVEIIRASTSEGIAELNKRGVESAHLIYVDANHQYETVLDDLILYKRFLHVDYGCFQLNDCCHSEDGVKQNLGVLEAANKFCKMYDFIPVAMVNRDFTDVLIAPRRSTFVGLVNNIFNDSNIGFVEIPYHLFPCASIRKGARPNVSFL